MPLACWLLAAGGACSWCCWAPLRGAERGERPRKERCGLICVCPAMTSAIAPTACSCAARREALLLVCFEFWSMARVGCPVEDHTARLGCAIERTDRELTYASAPLYHTALARSLRLREQGTPDRSPRPERPAALSAACAGAPPASATWEPCPSCCWVRVWEEAMRSGLRSVRCCVPELRRTSAQAGCHCQSLVQSHLDSTVLRALMATCRAVARSVVQQARLALRRGDYATPTWPPHLVHLLATGTGPPPDLHLTLEAAPAPALCRGVAGRGARLSWRSPAAFSA